MLPKPDVIQLLSHATVFACPSIYEPLGIVNLEAMACEAAVVATATGGIVEVVVDGETGPARPVRAGAGRDRAARPGGLRARLRRARQRADRRPGAGRGDGPRRARAGADAVRLARDRGADRGRLPAMRQLTSLDAQFLALENDRQVGPRRRAGDPRSRHGARRRAHARPIERLIAARLAALPPLRWRVREVPLGLDYPYWVDDPDFDLDYHVRELALPRAGLRRAARRAGGADLLAPARPRAAAVGALRDPRARGRAVGVFTKIHHAVDRRHVRRGGHGPAARPDARGARGPRRPPPPPRGRARGARDARPQRARRRRATRCGWCARCPPRCCTPPRRRRSSARSRGRTTASRAGRPRGGPGRRRRDRAPGAQGAAHVVLRPRLAAPAVRLRPAPARRGQGGQERPRRHRQRRPRRLCAGAVRRWLLAHEELPASRSWPRSRCPCARRAARDLRQPDPAHARAAVHRRAGSGASGSSARTRRCGR